MNFFYKLMHGQTEPDLIHDYIDNWHRAPAQMIPLYQYLGMTWREFKRWVELDATLETLVQERMDGVTPELMTNEELINELPMTTREEIKIELGARLGPGDETS